MSSTSRAWMVAASKGVVEALKDQGVCRWNYSLRPLRQYAKINYRSYSHPQMSVAVSKKLRNSQSEESLRTVMYLSCWGPNN